MTRAINKCVLDFVELVLEVVRAVDCEGTETKIQGDTPFLGLRILVKGRGTCDCAQALSK